ncbi:MAG: group II intron reverse transcriptase/maturase [Gammaproteobacteria bacterium]|nr:group II intron reverse transcriptase/maturase [Gammaproteobacteria bacterium]
MVVKDYLEPLLEPQFDESSYGYRPRKSAHEAMKACRESCHANFWAIDLDIKGFFDHMDHELLLKALSRHTEEKWIHMYVTRWLEAPVMTREGLQEREKGTPQGGVISPLLANLYLHYAFDKWLRIHYPQVSFERYADDIVVHCKRRESAESLLRNIQDRLKACGLQAHLGKTQIVYCKASGRKDNYPTISFDFLGYTFKPRRTQTREGKIFLGFNPGISNKSIQRMNGEISEMRTHLGCMKTIEQVARAINPKVRGWINYYGKFRKSDLQRLYELINNRLIQWVRKKYKRVKRRTKQAADWLRRVYRQNPFLFLHWYYTTP